MKVKIGPFKNYFGPYQLADLLCFWAKKKTDEFGFKSSADWVHSFGDWLAGYKDDGEGNDIGKESNLSKFFNWVYSKRTRTVKVELDKFDTWNMDGTLAIIILPMLKQLKDTKHGSPYVDDQDVPEHLRSTAAPKLTEEEKNNGHTDALFHDRWEWVMEEMIWAFQQLQPDFDWESQYYSGEADIKWKKTTSEEYKLTGGAYEMVKGPKDTFSVDYEGLKKHDARIANGLVLFGKYYRGLWD